MVCCTFPPSSQLYAMDLRFLDPRRPKTQKPSAQDMEERLIPYQENLPFMPNGFATLDKQVGRSVKGPQAS